MVIRARTALFAALLSPLALLSETRPWLVLLGVGLVVVVVWLIDFLLAADPQAIGLVRRLPHSVTLGSESTLRWELVNRSTSLARLEVADGLPPSLGATTRRASLDLSEGQTATIEIDIEPTRRGRFTLEEFTIRSIGPLGFAARQKTRRIPETLRVLPRYPSRAEAELRLKRHRLDVGLRTTRARGGGSEFDQLRDFTIDDEFRKIDWSATARTGRTIVRTYRAERNQTVINVLDNGRLMAGQVASVPRVEHAMDAIMAVTTVATGLGDRAGLLVFDHEIRASVPASARVAQLGRVTRAMYAIEPELAESDYRGAFTQVLTRFARRTMLVIHTDLVEQSVGEFLLPALPLLTRNHVVVIAAVRDPQVDLWARQSPQDAEASYRHAAARDALAERRRTIAALRRLGATVVDAPPGKLAGLLIDRYLDAKSTGRI